MMTLEARIEAAWEPIAKQPISCQILSGTKYAFTTELGALRLFYAFRHCGERAATGYSENLGGWYFRLEPESGESLG